MSNASGAISVAARSFRSKKSEYVKPKVNYQRYKVNELISSHLDTKELF